MASMKDFLTNYYRRLILSEMSYEQLVQFSGYIKDNKATDNQKIWADELLKKDPVTGEFETRLDTNIFIVKELPDPNDPTEGLNDEEWEKLFRGFQVAFQGMEANKNSFKYNKKATEFLEKYFGTNNGIKNIFQYEKIKPSVKDRLYKAPTAPSTVPVPGTLYEFLYTNRNILKSRLSGGYYSILTDDFSFDDLLSGLEKGKFDTNIDYRNKLQSVVEFIEGNKEGLVQAGIPRNNIPDLSDYQDWYDDKIDVFRLNQFKHEYPEILNTLRKDSKVRTEFASYDRGKITGPLNKALNELTYNDSNSEDYVLPKREDTLTAKERLAEWWSDTYSDCIEKYEKLKGDRLFFSDQAKNICKYLQKDLKKTDGLDGVLKNTGGAKEKLKEIRDFKSVKHLEWFEKTLKSLKNDPKLSKVWAGALRDGTHMQALVKEIIVNAVKEGKKEEAKTALELISVLHYDYTTSKIMETLKNEWKDFTLFSDKDLSWNQNKGVKLVTDALDKGLKTAFMGIGYGVTMIGNAIKLHNRKIKSYTDKNRNFKNEHIVYLEQQQQNKQRLEDLLNDEKDQQTTTQADVDRVLGGRTYDVAKTDIETSINNLKIRINDFHSAEITALKNALAQSYNNSLYGSWDPFADEAEYDAVYSFVNSIKTNTLGAKPTLSGPGTATLQPHLDAIEHDFANLVADRDALNTNDDEYDKLINGTDLLNQLNAQIIKHEDEFNNWDSTHVDEMEELVLYWNRLETGRNTKTGPMYNWFRYLSKKKAQSNLSSNVSTIVQQYNRSHTIAA